MCCGQAHNPGGVSAVRSGSVFVGRYRELTLLREGLGQLAHGSPMITSVVGEAGIGKTALVSQAMDSAAGLGIRVARSSAVEGGGSPAYWLWKDVLRQLSIGDQIDFDDPGNFDQQESGGATAGPIYAETRPQRVFRFYEAVTDCLRAHALEAPLLIIFDDLHWADDESLRLLAHFVRGLGGIDSGIGLILAYRDRPGGGPDPFSDAILQTARAAGSESIRLGPFSKDESAEVVQLITRDSERIGTGESGELFERTGGNPLFVTEIARMAAAGNDDDRPPHELPATVQLAINDRLRVLSPSVIELLETASLAHGAVTPAVLLDVMKTWTMEEVHGALGEATESRFLIEASEGFSAPGVSRSTIAARPDASAGSAGHTGASEWNFRHAVVQEAMASHISTGRRARIHAAYADALESGRQSADSGNSEALLFHALRAGPLIENGRVVRYLLFAARAAMRSLAFERAAGHFLGVIELSEAEEVDGSLAEAMHGFALAGSGMGRDQQIAD